MSLVLAGRLGLLCLLSSLSCWIMGAWAHPVAQGSMTVVVAGDTITMHVRIAAEEAIVANAFAPPADQATTIPSMLQAHAAYLARHVRLTVNGQRLQPTSTKPVSETIPADERIDYELLYRFPADASSPRSSTRSGPLLRDLRIEQDVLNEFEFAPGNPWEATFVVNITAQGRVLLANRLLTSRTPIVYADQPSGRLLDGESTMAGQDELQSFSDYLWLGASHILGGYDHLLFICALVLTARSLWDLIKVVSVFTLAHSLTLTLSVLDVVRLPDYIVEPIIAASIVVVAGGNVLWPTQRRAHLRLLIAFGFGLFHGLGFAGGLLEVLGPQAGSALAVALVGFSLGVELGHQIVVLPLFAALRLLHAGPVNELVRSRMRATVVRYGSGAIMAGGLFYLVAALSMARLGASALPG